MKDAEHVFVYKDPELAHACNQVSLVTLQNGEVFMGFNEERYPVHADSGQSCFIKSKDGGRSWDLSTKQVIWPYTEFKGNWDCAFNQISNGTILMHTRVCDFIAPRGINSEGDQMLGLSPPGMPNALRGRRDMYCSNLKTEVTLGLTPSKSTRVLLPAHL